MTAQNDFVGHNATAIALTNATETAVAYYEAPADEDVDLILASLSCGKAGSNAEKVIFRIYLGNDVTTGSPVTETLRATGRGSAGSLGEFKSAGTIPGTKGNLVFRESVNQQSGYTNPQVIGIAKGTRCLVTAQLTGTDTAAVYFRGVFRKPGL